MTDELNKPLYSRIQEYIAEMTLSGKWSPESKILSERELSEDLGVSRMTVRKALTELVHEGLLERRHGSGTYVAKPKVTYESPELVNYVQAMQQRNIATASQLLEFSEMAASRRLGELLEVEIGTPLYHIVLLRLANRVPVILERGYFPGPSTPHLEDWDLEKSSMLDLLASIYQIHPGRISQTFGAIGATDTIAQQLRVEEGFPLLILSRLIYSADTQKPVVLSQDYLRSDYARIHTDVELGRMDQPRVLEAEGRKEGT